MLLKTSQKCTHRLRTNFLGVKLCLESICLLLGEQTTDWKSIRQIIIRDNFIPTIIKFETEDISDNIRKIMNDKWVKNLTVNAMLPHKPIKRPNDWFNPFIFVRHCVSVAAALFRVVANMNCVFERNDADLNLLTIAVCLALKGSKTHGSTRWLHELLLLSLSHLTPVALQVHIKPGVQVREHQPGQSGLRATGEMGHRATALRRHVAEGRAAPDGTAHLGREGGKEPAWSWGSGDTH